MDNKNNPLLLSDTAVPDLFIYYHLMNLSKEAIALYLCILSAGESCERRPVDSVTWYDAIYFCNLSIVFHPCKLYTIT